MQVSIFTKTTLSIFTGLLLSEMALAHVSITNKLYANSYSQIELAVPHGCEGFDTVKVEVTIPDGFTGVRPLNSVFGPATVELDQEDAIFKIVWTTNKTEPYAIDSHAYSLAFRAKTPDAVFSTLYFPTVQTCEDQDGNIFTSEWIGTQGHDHSDASGVLPSPSALLYPKVTPGWSQFLINEHLHDLSIFSDAEIVWLDSAAYSANPHTVQLIQEDSEASTLSEIHPGSMIWVKY